MVESRFIFDADSEVRMSKAEYEEGIARRDSKYRQEMDALKKQYLLLQVKYDNLLKATKSIAYCLNFEKEA